MNTLWQRYAARFDALSLRERVWVFAGVIVAVLALAYTLLIEPEVLKQKRLSAAIAQKQTEMNAFEAQLTKLVGNRAKDPDRVERDRLAQLRLELASLDARVSGEERRFTPPSQMRQVVEGLLARNRSVALVEMKTIAPATLSPLGKPVAKPAASGSGKGEKLIYRHGLELTVSGSYLDLLGYVRDLERLPNQLYWGGLELDAGSYPKVALKMTIYTLSLDPTWLSV